MIQGREVEIVDAFSFSIINSINEWSTVILASFWFLWENNFDFIFMNTKHEVQSGQSSSVDDFDWKGEVNDVHFLW